MPRWWKTKETSRRGLVTSFHKLKTYRLLGVSFMPYESCRQVRCKQKYHAYFVLFASRVNVLAHVRHALETGLICEGGHDNINVLQMLHCQGFSATSRHHVRVPYLLSLLSIQFLLFSVFSARMRAKICLRLCLLHLVTPCSVSIYHLPRHEENSVTRYYYPPDIARCLSGRLSG